MLKGEYCRRRIQQQTSTLPFQVLINIWWRKGVRAVWWGTKYGGNRKHRRNARGEDSLHDTVRGLLYQQKSASRSPQQWLNRIWPSNTISFASNFMYMSFVVASSSCFLAERYEHCLLIDKKKWSRLPRPRAWGNVSASPTWSTRPMTGCGARS